MLTLLDPKGMIAADETHIFIVSAVLMLLVVIPVVMMTLAFAWRYREGNIKADYAPEWSHSTILEVIWWSIPCVIVVILGVMTWTSSHRLDPYKPLAISGQKTITIQAIALQWKWLFIYPEQHIATVNYIEIPTGAPVQFLITSEGPMNSFQIQQLAGQIYAMAGMQTKLHLIANEPGTYKGISANFSGEGFSDMTFQVRATSQEQFNQWVKTVKQSPNKLTTESYDKLSQRSIKDPVRYYSSTTNDVFVAVMMKNMTPGKDLSNLCDRNILKVG